MRLTYFRSLAGLSLQLRHLKGRVSTGTDARRFLTDDRNGGGDDAAAAAAAVAKLIYPDAPTKEHSDLATFLAYVKRTKLNRNSSVYRGTHYEYTVAEALAQYGFSLKRVGGSSDRGLDLLGTWTVPTTTTTTTRVMVQCKAGLRSPGPGYVRELKGAMAAAPAGWRGPEVLGFLVGEKPATRGVLEELRTEAGMGYVCCSREGEVVQLLWNRRAQEVALEGVTVGVKYVDGGAGGRKMLVLVKGGKMLPLLGGLEGGGERS